MGVLKTIATIPDIIRFIFFGAISLGMIVWTWTPLSAIMEFYTDGTAEKITITLIVYLVIFFVAYVTVWIPLFSKKEEIRDGTRQ